LQIGYICLEFINNNLIDYSKIIISFNYLLMEDSYLLKSNRFKYIKNNNIKGVFILIFIFISLISFYLIIKNNNMKKISETNIFNTTSINEIKQNEEDNMLQIYVENKTYYYILGRQNFMKRHGKSYNESNIVTIQDKMNWLLIHEFPEEKAKVVDKILLREYAKKILGKDICPKILKIYNNSDEINLKELPNKFIIKCNHGSGMNIFVKDKSKFKLNRAKLKLNKWMKINFGLKTFQYVYIHIKRKIFIEEYLSDKMGIYKIDCFNGSPKFIRAYKLFKHKHFKICNIYDVNWKLTNIETGLGHIKRNPKIIFKKPKNLNLMLEYSRKLSADFAFVRVDFYYFKEKIYLSELTFTTSNILMPFKNKEQSIYLGSLLDITKIKKFSQY